MLFARDDITGEDIDGDPEQFEQFVSSGLIDVAEYPPNYDPDDPEQEVIVARNIRVKLSLTSEPYNDTQSFQHISVKNALKYIKKFAKDLKE